MSAWNDNQVEAHPALYMMREEHFGGLGFMISRRIWLDVFRPDILDNTDKVWDFTLSFITMNKKEAQEQEWSSIYPSVSLVHHTPSSSFLSAG